MTSPYFESLVKNSRYGIDSEIGEFGSKISGGQVQRIAIARALYRDKEIIILDEATSALDAEIEMRLLTMLSSHIKDKTMLFVTHRESVLKICNRIIKINKGQIVDASNFNAQDFRESNS